MHYTNFLFIIETRKLLKMWLNMANFEVNFGGLLVIWPMRWGDQYFLQPTPVWRFTRYLGAAVRTSIFSTAKNGLAL